MSRHPSHPVRSPALPRALALTATVLAVLVAAGGPAPAAHAATGTAATASFVPGTEDLPLAPGLAVRDDGLVFDKPDGRIVEAVAEGVADAAGIRRFYADTLPQLGWQPTGADRWRREGEELVLRFERAGGRTLVRFALSPRSP